MEELEKLSDEDIISLFEFRYDYGGNITKELLDRYIDIIESR